MQSITGWLDPAQLKTAATVAGLLSRAGVNDPAEAVSPLLLQLLLRLLVVLLVCRLAPNVPAPLLL
jgi:hypothetical protein